MEVHSKSHDHILPLKCNICDKEFYVNWRLKKHILSHDLNLKFCHFYNNGKNCPYEDVGCKFKHKEAKSCRFDENCDKKLCQFKHSQNKQKLKENNLSKNNTERVDDLEKEDTIYEDDQLTVKEKEFELYVKTSFRRVFDYVLQNKKHTPCYFCDYVSKSQILKIGADEISDHLEEEHQEIIAEFNPDSSTFENNLHKEFLEFLIIG